MARRSRGVKPGRALEPGKANLTVPTPTVTAASDPNVLPPIRRPRPPGFKKPPSAEPPAADGDQDAAPHNYVLDAETGKYEVRDGDVREHAAGPVTTPLDAGEGIAVTPELDRPELKEIPRTRGATTTQAPVTIRHAQGIVIPAHLALKALDLPNDFTAEQRDLFAEMIQSIADLEQIIASLESERDALLFKNAALREQVAKSVPVWKRVRNKIIVGSATAALAGSISDGIKFTIRAIAGELLAQFGSDDEGDVSEEEGDD